MWFWNILISVFSTSHFWLALEWKLPEISQVSLSCEISSAGYFYFFVIYLFWMQELLAIQISLIYASKPKLWNSIVSYSPQSDCLRFPYAYFSSLKRSCSFLHTNIHSTMLLTYRWFKHSRRRYEKLLLAELAGLFKWQTGQDPGEAITESQKRNHICCI